MMLLVGIVVVVLTSSIGVAFRTQAWQRRVPSRAETGGGDDDDEPGLSCANPESSKGISWRLVLIGFVLGAGLVYAGINNGYWSYFKGTYDGEGEVQKVFQCTHVSPSRREALIGEVKGVAHPIYTTTEHAQTHFEQGLLFRWGYNAHEASKSFRIAHDLDPACAMCLWGQAYALIPSLNYLPAVSKTVKYPAFHDKDLKTARGIALQALDVAKDNRRKSPQDGRVQKDLEYIEALLLALPDGSMTRGGMYQAGIHFASKLLEIWLADPRDVDAGVLAAEAILNMISWDTFGESSVVKNLDNVSWTSIWEEAASITRGLAGYNGLIPLDTMIDLQEFFLQFPLPESMHSRRVSPSHTHMRLGARVVEEILLRILSINHMHPFAHHLHIHLTEEGFPGISGGGVSQATLSAQNLVALAPNMGHLLHMPSHTFFRIGLFKEAVEANINAYDQAVSYAMGCISEFAPEHNLDVLISAASMAGMYDVAVKYSELISQIHTNLPGPYIAKGSDYEKLLFVWLRFGMWANIENHFPPNQGSRGSSGLGGQQYSKVLWEFAQFLLISRKHSKDENGKLTNQEVDNGALNEHIVKIDKLVLEIPDTVATEPGRGAGVYSCPYSELGHILLLLAKARLSYLHAEKVKPFIKVTAGNQFLKLLHNISAYRYYENCLELF